MSLHIMRGSFINIYGARFSAPLDNRCINLKKQMKKNKKKYISATFYREKGNYHAQVIFS